MTDFARDAFTYFDVDVSELSDEQCAEAADLIVERYGGVVPDIKQIVVVVAEVSAEAVADQPVSGAESVAGVTKTTQEPSPHVRRTINFPGWHPVYPPLTLVPKRQEKLGPFDPHPACDVAYVDGGYVCSRCIPLLHPALCDCEVCSEWMFKADEL